MSVHKLGDLSEPDLDSPLSKSQKKSSSIFGAEETFYITNGTSTSNKAMLMTLLKPGERVLLDRNCHKSVHQAVVMSGAWPVYLTPKFNETLGVWTPLPLNILEENIHKEYHPESKKPRMLILTTCSYEGIIYPINEIARMCEREGILFFADEAWAPYLRFHPRYTMQNEEGEIQRYNAIDGGAHFAVQSTHKALAAFSQASMLHISPSFKRWLEDTATEQWEWLRRRFSFDGNGSYPKFRHELIEMLRYWHTTSPHYPMLASLDKAGIQMCLEGTELLEERINWVRDFTEYANGLVSENCIVEMEHIVGSDNIKNFKGYIKDPLKLVLGFRDENSGRELKRILENKHIQWEKATSGCIEFLVTIGTYGVHMKALKDVLNRDECRRLLGCPNPKALTFNEEISGQVEVLPRMAAACDGELIRLDESKGRICAQMLVPYPPGIPVFLPGLRITEKMIELVDRAIGYGGVHDVHGIFERGGIYCVKVMKEDEEKRGIKLLNSAFS